MTVKEQIDSRLGNLKGDLENFSQEVKKGGRQVWLAGLGAVSVVDDQRRALFGAHLNEQFDELVEKGQERRRRIEVDARQAFDKVGDKARELGRQVESRASDRMNRTLERLGVPTSAQIQLLIDRVEQLNTKVEKLAHG